MKNQRGWTKQDAVASSRRAAREAHFAAGGTSGTWMRQGSTFKDRKHEANRRACRGRVSED